MDSNELHKNRNVKLSINLVDRKADQDAPPMAFYAVEGVRIEKIAAVKDGAVVIPVKALRNPEAVIGLGPDVDDDTKLRSANLVTFRVADAVAEWQRNAVVNVMPEIYGAWNLILRCVSGRVRRCTPWAAPIIAPSFPPILPRLTGTCRPICNGVVEIFERTCCCRRIRVIGDIIDIIRERLIPIPIPDPDPGPLGPVPLPDPPRFRAASSFQAPGSDLMFNPQPEPPKFFERPAVQKLHRIDPAELQNINVELQETLRADLRDLARLGSPELARWIDLRPYIWPWLCSCSSRKLGEAVIRPDGTFTFCWSLFPYLTAVHCRRSYFYKARQWQDGEWVYLYDGVSRHEYFQYGEFADLETMFGRVCGQDDPNVDNDKPFVMLQNIGGTSSSELNSHWLGKNVAGADLTQTSANGMAPPPANGGLANPSSSNGDGLLVNRPWGDNLALLLFFHPDMKALGAHYYRISRVPAVNGQPQPGATPVPLTSPLSWSKFVLMGGQWEIVGESLGPDSKTVGSETVNGLYKIPYITDALWLGNQYHGVWPTGTASDKFLLYIEVFDSAGNRLTPSANNFDFLRRLEVVGPDSTAKVGFDRLAHYFWVDNRPTVADIVDLRRNGVPSTDECQFMSGPPSMTFSTGFRAYHQTVNSVAPPETFMYYYRLRWQRGLNNPYVTFETGGANQPSTLGGGSPAESSPLTFEHMLGTSTTGAKCTFSVQLASYAKHTNGSRRLHEYDRYETASFALEISS